ncbi:MULTISPECIES: SIS domain-containing protein [unclassified Clostridium]|uniref:SIS domain-containing protein n=1 Tax=unclassified Clostridium TaxID=2614128 RepID=UPI0025C3D191|nr:MULTISPECIES: SIS domain-containing protein [unclassified Clostridium]
MKSKVDINEQIKLDEIKITMIDEHSLLIVTSQAGETANTLAVLRLAKSKAARIIVVTNVVGITVSKEAEEILNNKDALQRFASLCRGSIRKKANN